MSGRLVFQCPRCLRVFNSGFAVGPGASARIVNCATQCPFCSEKFTIPDVEVQTSLEGLLNIVQLSPNAISEAKELQQALKKVSTAQELNTLKVKFSKYRDWLPDSPQKLAAYIEIIGFIIKLLQSSPQSTTNIQFSQTIVQEYNSYIVNQTQAAGEALDCKRGQSLTFDTPLSRMFESR